MPVAIFGIIVSALNTALGFLVRSLLVKFVSFFALFFIVHEFMGVIASMLPSGSSLTAGMSGIPAGVWYFLDLFAFSYGVPLVLSAAGLRFIIRRIPIIG